MTGGKRSSALRVVLLSLLAAPRPGVCRLDELLLKLSSTFFMNSITVWGMKERVLQFYAPTVSELHAAGFFNLSSYSIIAMYAKYSVSICQLAAYRVLQYGLDRVPAGKSLLASALGIS